MALITHDSIHNLEEIPHLQNPFEKQSFIKTLEQSKSVSMQTGWCPTYFEDENHQSYGFIKSHSYGEYIFDWAWADLYQRVGVNYYPKLLHATPFSPVSANRVLSKIDNNDNQKNFLKSIFDYYMKNNFSSHHFLFAEKEIKKDLTDLNYFKKLSIQYHFFNKWNSFDEFLVSLKTRKRKQIRKERRKVQDYIKANDLKICRERAIELTQEDLHVIYSLYLTTIDKKQAHPYLTRDFFLLLKNNSDAFFYLVRPKDPESNEILAMSLLFESPDTLYGRYWGCTPQISRDSPFLHFDLCYYQGIEYCMERKIKKFEAGAQGEHKLLRGFVAVEIDSFHHIKNSDLSSIIIEHTQHQNQIIKNQIKHLNSYLPFKSD